MSHFEKSALESPTGASIRLFHAMPSGSPRAIIQINHGMAEHAARYDRFAGFLTARGYAVFAHDHRGHGSTKAADAPLGVFAASNGMAKVLDDVNAVIAHARAACPGAPLITFGHSMGAIIALNHAHAHPGRADGLALWNTSFDTPFLLQVLKAVLLAEGAIRGRNTPSAVATRLTFEAWNKEFAPNRTAFDWLSRDTAEVDAYVADPLCGFGVSIGLWLDVLNSILASAKAANVARIAKDLPVNITAGGMDPSSLKGAAMLRLADRLKAAGIKDVELTVWPQTRHEGLNEINRDAIMASFADWLDRRFPAR